MDRQWLEIPVLRQTWPRRHDLSLQEAAVRLGRGENLSDLFAQWQGLTALRKAVAPIVGVVGQLNAGKSSLVRSFLSDQGAGRVLCGLGASRGTQRFVFWLPEGWQRDAVVLEALEGELESVFGASREWLSDVPEEAHRQYNGGGAADAFSTPLVAFDPRLDELGFGLLDCPDVQRGMSSQGAPTADWLEQDQIRQEFVSRASRLMSAVVVVASRAWVGDKQMEFFRGPQLGLRDKPRFLLLNSVRNTEEAVETLLEDAEIRGAMGRLAVDELFAAYDFSLNGVHGKIPVVAADEAGREVPVFFQVAAESGANLADAVPRERLLRHRLAALAPQDLWRERRKERGAALVRSLTALHRDLSVDVARRTENIQSARSGVMDYVREVCAPEGLLRFPITPHVAEQLATAIGEAAPLLVRPSLKANTLVNDSWETVKRFAGTCRDIASPAEAAKARAREAVERIKSSEGSSYFQAENLARGIRHRPFMPDIVDEARLVDLWNGILRDVNNLEVILPGSELRAFGKKFWEEVTVWKKMSLAALGPVLLLGSVVAACTAPLDFGGSAVIMAASSTELLAALGIGVASAKMAGGILDTMLLRHVAVPMYTRLVAATLDAFHLPRTLDQVEIHSFENLGHVQLDLAASTIPVGPARLPLVDDPFLAGEIPGAWDDVRRLIETEEGEAK